MTELAGANSELWSIFDARRVKAPELKGLDLIANGFVGFFKNRRPVLSRLKAAAARIEEIIRRLDSGEAGLRETLELCREGRGLVEHCAAELEAVGRGLEELRLDELVARLEAGRAS